MADFNIAPTKPRRPGPIARKDAGSENFPVASRLLPKHLRPHVMAFYRFVRLADDIADDPDLEPETKLAYLEALERALTSGQTKHAYLKPALELRASLQSTGVSDRHARQVLRAFRRDAVGARCHSWSDLLLYCRFSANPVGRYLLDLHGEGMAAGPAGAWIGTSEFADAAGFAAAAAMGDERAIKTFTLMKVVGRDMFVGIWALMVAWMSVTVWEKKEGNGKGAERVDIGEVWRRFPKFVIGFFVASIFTTILIASVAPKVGSAYSKDALGVIKTLRGWTFTWTFLSIGFTTRFRELTATGWKPFAAFTIGVLINVPLGYWLSNHVFVDYWLNVK